MRKLTSGVIASTMAVCLLPVHALEGGQVPNTPNYAGWIKYLADSCPKQAVDAVSHPGAAPMFKYRPADIGAICECTIQRFKADERLRAYLDVEPALLARRLTPQIQAYGGHRFFHSLMTCLGPEMDRSLIATPFD